MQSVLPARKAADFILACRDNPTTKSKATRWDHWHLRLDGPVIPTYALGDVNRFWFAGSRGLCGTLPYPGSQRQHNIALRFGRRNVADWFERATMVEPVDPFARDIFDGFKATPRPAPVNNVGFVEARCAEHIFVRARCGAGAWATDPYPRLGSWKDRAPRLDLGVHQSVISSPVSSLENGVSVGLPVKEGAVPIFDREWCRLQDSNL